MKSNKQIPARRERTCMLTERSPFIIKEAYRALRTNVLFSLPGTECKVVGVSSPMAGDGKSTTAAGLAISLAQIGKRVLLIDCDMRLPTIAEKFKITAAPGLSDFLTGQARIEDVVRKLEDKGIHIMPAGNTPPDPTGLLESKQVEHLFTAFRNIYDFVIVDLPPVIAVPDASILSKYIDGYLLVVRQKQTKHKMISEALRRLHMAAGNIIGFVSTGSDVEQGYSGQPEYTR